MTSKNRKNDFGYKGQSALEYLMTHAWAMVAIAVVIGVIIFVFGKTPGGVNCTSDDIKIIYYDHAVYDDGELTLVLQNATGRTINDASAVFAGDFAGTGSSSPETVMQGKNFIISGNTDIGNVREYKGKIKVSYKTSTGIQHTANIACAGITGGESDGSGPEDPPEEWYNENWSYRQKITLNSSQVSATLSNFPVAINLQASSNPLFGNAKSDGADILFTNADNSAKLSHELVNYDESSGDLEAHVKIPSLSGSSDTVIYMYYGNSSASDQSDKTNVWSSNYRLVYHMSDLTTSTIEDSKGTSNGTKTGANEPVEISGKLGKAQSFDGDNDMVNLGSSNTITGDNLQTLTYSAWVKTTNTSVGYISSIKRSSTHSTLITLVQNQPNSGRLGFLTRNEANNNHVWLTDSDNYNNGTWHHVVATIDGLTRTLYIDGVQKGTDNIGMQSVSGNTAYASIGAFQTSNIAFNGAIDEVRFSRTVRSSEWIETTYNNQNSSSSFMDFGSEETN